MSDVFRKYITSGAGLSEEEVHRVLSKSVSKRLRRRQFLLQQGDVAKYHCFVVKGLLRAYRLKEDSQEHIIRFAPETWWMGDQQSLRTGEPSLLYIDAIEPTEVLLWTKPDFDELLQTIPSLKIWSEQLLAKSAATSYNRIYTTISSTAEEKYEDYIKSYPNLYERIPLHMLASYLGVTRETLSRIRKKLGHSTR